MLRCMFGHRQMVADRYGVMREVGQYSLHVQCAWRITCEDKLVTAPVDLCMPVDSRPLVGDDFDWQKGNLFDKKAALLFPSERPQLKVIGAIAGNAGFLSLALEGGYQIEVFPDQFDECWRLFDFDENTPHFVVTGKGIEGPDSDDAPVE